jgi:hypothetical protein
LFWVPKEAAGRTFRPTPCSYSISKLIDEAMAAIQVANPGLKVLPKDNRPALDKVMLGRLRYRQGRARRQGEGHRVYEYFLFTLCAEWNG